MFVAGIEIFFGFVAGALLLIAGVVTAVKLPRLLWEGLKAANEWIVRLPRGWRFVLFFLPGFTAMAAHQQWIAVIGGAWIGIFILNQVVWELRTGSPWLRKFCAIAFGFLFFLMISGFVLDWMAK